MHLAQNIYEDHIGTGRLKSLFVIIKLGWLIAPPHDG